MDQLPVNILTAVCNFLPLKDRLAVRRFSSKFGQLQCDLISASALSIMQQTDVISFRLKLKGVPDCHQRRTIEIINEKNQKEDYYFYRSVGLQEEAPIRKTTIHCVSLKFQWLVDLYISLFVKHFVINNLQLVNLSDDFLAMVKSAFLQQQLNLDWEKSHRSLTMYTRNRQLTAGERGFLEYCNNPVSFTFSPPADFQPPDDFWHLGSFSKSKGILLRFGHLADGSKEKEEIAVDLRIGDAFLEKLVTEKKKRFVVNSILDISVEFLMKYIENCINGHHIIYTLYFRRTFDDEERTRLIQFLDDHGFERYSPNLFFVSMKRTTKQGYDPDHLIVGLHANVVQVLGDFACYRGRKSKRFRP